MDDPEGVAYFLTATDEGAVIRQLEFDKYLGLAFRHNIVEDDLLKRLKNNQWDVFFQARNELMAAFIIENIGHSITFHPHGRGNAKGEFTIHIESGDIFSEVKSPIRKPANHVWTGNDAATIRKVIRDAANKQLDKNKMNLLIFAGDMKASITHEYKSGVIEALYGSHKLVFDVSESGLEGSPEIEFEPSGLFQPHRNTRISAVATLEDRLTENGLYYKLNIFHNPFAAMYIPLNVFSSCKQFVLNSVTNTMEWVEAYTQINEKGK